MFNIRSFFSNFFLLLFHLACFSFSSHHHHHRRRDSSTLFKYKLIPSKKTLLSSLKSFFSFSSSSAATAPQPPPPPPSIPSPSSSTRSLRLNPPLITPLPPTQDYATSNHISPCSICGEIFHSSTLLDQHQSTKHAVSELIDGENIVRIIFKMGWPEKMTSPTIHRILKIHNTPKIVARFEEYRELVKSRAAAKSKNLRDERCIADGNELLRFYCTTFTCDLNSSICSQHYCSACGIIRSGFSQKMDGISTLPTSWRAHRSIPDDLEDEFSFMHLKRALLLCRVISGRVSCDPGLPDKEGPGFDSLVGPESDELLVFNPRAVLPCFVIVYTV